MMPSMNSDAKEHYSKPQKERQNENGSASMQTNAKEKTSSRNQKRHGTSFSKSWKDTKAISE